MDTAPFDPSIQSTFITPVTQTVGKPVTLSVTAPDLDNAPEPLRYCGTSNDDPLMNADSATPTFTCASPGSATTYVEISDGRCTMLGTLNFTCFSTGPVVDGEMPADAGPLTMDGSTERLGGAAG